MFNTQIIAVSSELNKLQTITKQAATKSAGGVKREIHVPLHVANKLDFKA
jgi:hypothetical protein